MAELALLLLVICFGLIIGSFLTVCIYRIPFSCADGEDEPAEDNGEAAEGAGCGESLRSQADRDLEAAFDFPTIENKDISILKPARSFCPHCNQQLLWWHNVPLFSWLMLGGRCAFCKHPIPARYPIVEALSALFALLAYSQHGLTPTGILIYAFACALLVISFIDIDYYIIPDLISMPGTAVGVAAAIATEYTDLFTAPLAATLFDSLLGILAGGGFLWVISEGYLRMRGKVGLGLGDVKLLSMTGAFFGPECSIYTIFIGSLLGVVFGALQLLGSGRKLSQPIPFGPYLALATLLFIFSGDYLLVTLHAGLGTLLGLR